MDAVVGPPRLPATTCSRPKETYSPGVGLQWPMMSTLCSSLCGLVSTLLKVTAIHAQPDTMCSRLSLPRQTLLISRLTKSGHRVKGDDCNYTAMPPDCHTVSTSLHAGVGVRQHNTLRAGKPLVPLHARDITDAATQLATHWTSELPMPIIR